MGGGPAGRAEDESRSWKGARRWGASQSVFGKSEYMEDIEKYRTDREEVEKLAFYKEIKGKKKIAPIDEKLLEYWDK